MLLWARYLKKKELIEENYITTFNFLNLGLIANVEKIILKIDFLKLNLRLSIFAFTEPKYFCRLPNLNFFSQTKSSWQPSFDKTDYKAISQFWVMILHSWLFRIGKPGKGNFDN